VNSIMIQVVKCCSLSRIDHNVINSVIKSRWSHSCNFMRCNSLWSEICFHITGLQMYQMQKLMIRFIITLEYTVIACSDSVLLKYYITFIRQLIIKHLMIIILPFWCVCAWVPVCMSVWSLVFFCCDNNFSVILDKGRLFLFCNVG